MEKNINLDYDDEVVKKMVEDGFDVEFGARPMRRVAELVLGDLIGAAILKNEIKSGDRVKLSVNEVNKFVLYK